MRAFVAAPCLLLFASACQSATSGGGGTGPSCALPSGSFIERFSGDDSGAGCPTLSDRTFVLDGTESPGDALGNTDAGYGLTRCATDVDPSSCAYSANCTTTVDGGTALVVFTTVTFDGDSARGEQTMEPNTCSTDTCTYAITITKGD
jgi:hypothetical protein